MKISFFLKTVVSLCLFFSACNGQSFQELKDKNESSVRQGYAIIPIAASLSKKFGLYSMVSDINNSSVPKDWISVFYLFDRYEVVFKTPVEYDLESNILKLKNGDPEMTIREIRSIDLTAGGNVRTIYQGLFRKLNSEEIADLMKKNWDFEGIGVKNAGALPNIEKLKDSMKSCHASGAGEIMVEKRGGE